MLTDQQVKFIEISKKYEELKNQMKELKPQLDQLLTEIGVGNMFQDPEDGTVFQVVEPSGRFVYFDKISYDRTKREGEKVGSLSLKKAEEAGFSVK